MRTTVRLDPDIAAAVDRLRDTTHVSLTQAVNTLARQGLAGPDAVLAPFVQRTASLGLTVDVNNIAEALDQLDGVQHA
jgi:predicted transcriptional regulator